MSDPSLARLQADDATPPADPLELLAVATHLAYLGHDTAASLVAERAANALRSRAQPRRFTFDERWQAAKANADAETCAWFDAMALWEARGRTTEAPQAA